MPDIMSDTARMMKATTKDREAYKRANMLRLPTWEIAMVNAGQCDREVRRFIDGNAVDPR